jgi:hypothetical protein
VNGLDDDNGIVDDTPPIARIMANNVSMLIEKPNICKEKSSDDRYGTAIAGIKVDLKSCKNK